MPEAPAGAWVLPGVAPMWIGSTWEPHRCIAECEPKKGGQYSLAEPTTEGAKHLRSQTCACSRKAANTLPVRRIKRLRSLWQTPQPSS